jgi:hypothetical protein
MHFGDEVFSVYNEKYSILFMWNKGYYGDLGVALMP